MSSPGKRLSILSEFEVQEAYSIPQLNRQERDHFFDFSDEELSAAKRLHSHQTRIHFLLMLGYFKIKPVCLVYSWKNIESDYRYLAQRYYPAANKKRHNLSRLERSRLYKKVCAIEKYQRCDADIELKLVRHLAERAKVVVDELQLFKDALRYFKSNHIAIPAYSTLQKLLSRAINTEETRLGILIRKHLKDQASFLILINSQVDQPCLRDLKKVTKAYKPADIKKELSRHAILSELAPIAITLLDRLKLSDGNVRYYAARCSKYSISELRELNKDKALLYLNCFVATRFRLSNDILTQSFLVAYKDFDEQSIEYRDEKMKVQALNILNDIEQVPHILNLFIDSDIDNSESFGDVRHLAFRLIPEGQMSLVSQQLAKVKPDKLVYQWEYVDSHFGQIGMNIRPLMKSLNIQCRVNSVLQKQIEMVKSAIASSSQPPLIDRRLIKRADKKHLAVSKDGMDQKAMTKIAHRSEFYLYRLLYKGIRNGDVFINNSIEYRNFDDYLADETTTLACPPPFSRETVTC